MIPYFQSYIFVISLAHFIFFSLSFSIAQNNTIDSLLKEFETETNDTIKINHLHKLCLEYLNTGRYDSAFHYANIALQIADKLNFPKGAATAYNIIGTIFLHHGDYDKALKNYFASLKIRKETAGKQTIADSYNNIGIVYYNQANYDKALENYFTSLKIREEIGDKPGISVSCNNIGIVYKNLGDLFRLNADTAQAVRNYDKALENYSASLKISEELGDKQNIIASYNNIGAIYQNQAERERSPGKVGATYDKALANYFTSLKISEEISDKQGIARSYTNIANTYLGKLNYDEAMVWLQKGMRLAKEIGVRDLVMLFYKGLSEAAEKKNDFRNAYKYFQLYSQVKDSIFNKKSTIIINELQTKYETEKKQLEIERQQIIIESRNYLICAITGALLLLAIIGILINIQLRSKAKRKSVELQQKLLRSQMNPHFIFNALASIQGSVLEKTPDEAADYISKFASLMRFILESSKEEYIPLSAEIKILSHYLELQQLRYNRVFEFSIKILPIGEDLGGAFIPPMLVQPFIENAIEHGIVNTCSKGFIDVRFEKKGNFIIFSAENYCLSLTVPTGKNNSSVRPVKEVKTKPHKSLAMDITKERLYYLNKGQRKKIHFEFLIENNEEAKTKISFYIPVTA